MPWKMHTFTIVSLIYCPRQDINSMGVLAHEDAIRRRRDTVVRSRFHEASKNSSDGFALKNNVHKWKLLSFRTREDLNRSSMGVSGSMVARQCNVYGSFILTTFSACFRRCNCAVQSCRTITHILVFCTTMFCFDLPEPSWSFSFATRCELESGFVPT